MKTSMAFLVRTFLTSILAGLLLAGSTPALAEEDGAPVQAPASPAGKPEGAGVVNVNTANVEELSRLPGVGTRKAEAIVARREKKKFARPEDLIGIKGIGRGVFKRCRPYVRVQGPTTLAHKVSASRK